MPPILRFILLRFVTLLVTLLAITMLLYGIIATFPPETRAMLYFPKNPGKNFKENSTQIIIDAIIKKYGLNDPFPMQYATWLSNLAQGNWGYSATAGDDVLPALLRLTPATVELTFYSIIFFLPLGFLAGGLAGSRKGKRVDSSIQVAASILTTIPPFVFAIVMMAIFYVGVYWFPPERLSDATRIFVLSKDFHLYTGLMTLDGLLNNRPDITVEALQHLVLPVITLSGFHWATLTRLTRTVMIEELGKDYIVAARARGISNRATIWRHAMRNCLAAGLSSSALSAASLVTGIFIIETIFNFQGVSQIIRNAFQDVPDVPAALGFCIFSVVAVLVIMFIFDLLQALADPRHREGVL